MLIIYDVVHKFEVHNILQRHQRRTELWPQAQATHTHKT